MRDDTVLATEVHGTGSGASAIRSPRDWLYRRAHLIDVLVAVGVFVYNLPILPLYDTSWAMRAGLLAVSLVLCVAHVVSRARPLLGFGAMLAAAYVQLLLGTPLIAADVLLLFAVYGLANRMQWRLSAAGAAAVVVWLLVATVPRLGEVYLNVGEVGVLILLVIWVSTWGTLVRTRREYVRQLQERAAQLERERDVRAQIAVVNERARIAREIHDVVAHSLSVVTVMSDGAAATASTDPQQARSAMLMVRDTGRSALSEMRRMLDVLRTDEPGSQMPQPGMDQLDALMTQSREAGVPVTFRHSGEVAGLSHGLGLTVYRIVQEGLTNVRKHAVSATRVDVSVAVRAGTVTVRVVDDGRAIPDTVPPVRSGHGLVGIRERVDAYGGTLRIGPRPAGGFEVSATLPVEGGSA